MKGAQWVAYPIVFVWFIGMSVGASGAFNSLTINNFTSPAGAVYMVFQLFGCLISIFGAVCLFLEFVNKECE